MLGIWILLYVVVTFDAYFIVEAVNPQIDTDGDGRKHFTYREQNPSGTFDSLDVKSFDKQPRKFEERLYESMQEDESPFASGVAGVIKEIVALTPGVGQLFPVMFAFIDMLTTEKDWQASLAASIVNTVDENTATTKATEILQMLKAIHSSLVTAIEANRETVFWDTRKDLDYMMNIFDESDSIFKKYPLLGAPILLNLAKMISKFSPEINTPYISCKMRNILVEYRGRTVDARLDKIKLKSETWDKGSRQILILRFDEMIVKAHAMTESYNERTFNKTSSWTCKHIVNMDANLLRLDLEGKEPIIINDQFGSEINFPHDMYCVLEYYSYVRHRIEQIFEFPKINDVCGPKDAPKPTGNYSFLKIIILHKL